ncbi:MAG: hypothetical protein DMF27_07615 [Verrucomicrobia bacterium]|nr:MAG: hypothetical protein DMF27_07615 [Verrucomicrobiota bacterium]
MSEQGSPGRERLHTYLNDHLAGSVAAIELLDDLIEHHSEDRFGKIFRDLCDEIEADQETLRNLIRKLGAKESAVRKAGAWLAEKFSRVKIGDADDSAELLQALEGLALGISGKQLLWRSLAAIEANFPALQGSDFSELEKRAHDQFERVERLRMQMVREAFRA